MLISVLGRQLVWANQPLGLHHLAIIIRSETASGKLDFVYCILTIQPSQPEELGGMQLLACIIVVGGQLNPPYTLVKACNTN